jgi:hypothetical protein
MLLGRRPRRPSARLLRALATLALPAPAAAGLPDVALPENVTAIMDLRLVGVDGERSWTDGGFGKSRFGPDDGDFELDPVAAEGTLVWQPPLSWDLTGTVAVSAQHEQDQPVDLVEAFLSWRPVPRGATRFSARAGLFWPPISLEHEGPAWSVSNMITPSAINSWVGEEVKVVALEAGAAREAGGGRLSATVGLFGMNDTAATLLSRQAGRPVQLPRKEFLLLSPWISLFPGLFIMLSVLAFNFISDGLRDHLDPWLRG